MWPGAGPTTAAGSARGTGSETSTIDVAVWQRLLQFCDARVVDLGFVEPEVLQVGQLLEMQQARVADLGGWELEEPQVYQPL